MPEAINSDTSMLVIRSRITMRPTQSRKSLRDAPPKVRRPPGSPTKSQLRALALIQMRDHAAKWKLLIPVASTTWSKIHPAELRHSEGNVHVLGGLVQRHYQISRQDADSQVRAFCERHLPTANDTAVAASPLESTAVIPVAVAVAVSEMQT